VSGIARKITMLLSQSDDCLDKISVRDTNKLAKTGQK
jgi:hypothetical protein